MRTITRSLIATAVAAPLLLLGSGSAFASDGGYDSGLGIDATVATGYQYNGGGHDDNDGILGDLLGGYDDSYGNEDGGLLSDLLGYDDDDDYNNDNSYDDGLLSGLLG